MVISSLAKNTWKDPLLVPRMDRLHILEQSGNFVSKQIVLLQNEKISIEKEFYLVARWSLDSRKMRETSSVSFTIILRNNSLFEFSLTRWFLWGTVILSSRPLWRITRYFDLYAAVHFVFNISDRRDIEKSCHRRLDISRANEKLFVCEISLSVAKGIGDSFRASAVSMTLRWHMKRNNGESKLLVEIYFIRS